jgi:N-acetylmuramidase
VPIQGSVGVNSRNRRDDVVFVQERIWVHRHWLDTVQAVQANGNCGPFTIAAIRKFQATAAALHEDDCDGVVSPRGFTIRRLELAIIPRPRHRVLFYSRWRREAGPLTRQDFESAATMLGCEIAAIRAVARQEAPRGAFDSAGRPTILYERHYFGGFTDHIYDLTHRDISSRSPSVIGGRTRDGYGAESLQYRKLYRAATLNENAALQHGACSR